MFRIRTIIHLTLTKTEAELKTLSPTPARAGACTVTAKPASTMSDRPSFELQPYNDETLPHGKRLTDPDQLVGHEIKAVCAFPNGELAYGSELVIVTQTNCWLVLRAEAGYTREEGADITTVRDHKAYRGEQEQLSDWLDAEEMRRLGLINNGEYEVIKAKEDERQNAKKQRKADGLRKELAELEGGAA